jgi:hypothetical protein
VTVVFSQSLNPGLSERVSFQLLIESGTEIARSFLDHSGLSEEEQNMRQQSVIKTTLGDLIAVVTDEVRSLVQDPSDVYIATSFVLNDLLAHHGLHVPRQSRRIRKLLS